MTKRREPPPTETELAILRVLWERGPSTVRDVHEVLARQKPTGYTTALKMLQVMTAKGLVLRDDAQRTHVYRARASEEQTQRQLVGELLRRAFGGSAKTLVMRALEAKAASPGELAEVRRLVEQLERDRTPGGPS